MAAKDVPKCLSCSYSRQTSRTSLLLHILTHRHLTEASHRWVRSMQCYVTCQLALGQVRTHPLQVGAADPPVPIFHRMINSTFVPPRWTHHHNEFIPSPSKSRWRRNSPRTSREFTGSKMHFRRLERPNRRWSKLRAMKS
jgi:hypothetical protein